MPMKTIAPIPNGVQMDPIIRVNRSARPNYPDWVKDILHPELESVGPVEYNIDTVELWLSDAQKKGWYASGQVIYGYLEANDMLEGCLGFSDLLAIQARGIVFYRQHFAGKAVSGFKSVVRGPYGNLQVPHLCSGDEVVMIWSYLYESLLDDHPVARFRGN